jgi:hypothetical protein
VDVPDREEAGGEHPLWPNRAELIAAGERWMDIEEKFSWLKPRPYFVDRGRVAEIRRGLTELGFDLVEAGFPGKRDEPEQDLLVDLSAKLGFSELGAGNWLAFDDRLHDFLRVPEPAVAIVVEGLDLLARTSLYSFVRCVHGLESLTDGIGVEDPHALRQVEYFFVGDW